MSSNDIVFADFSERTVLPPSAAVQAPRFTSDDHARSAIAREILDLDLPMPPRPPAAEPQQSVEAIEMSGYAIRRELRTGGHVVRQNSVAALRASWRTESW